MNKRKEYYFYVAEKPARKIRKEMTLFEALKILFMVIGFLVIAYNIMSVFFGYNIGFVSGESSSMNSVFSHNCLILYQRQVGLVEEGDIILYTACKKSIIHRMIGYCGGSGGSWAYKVRGDSPFNGVECVLPQDVYGKLVLKLC